MAADLSQRQKTEASLVLFWAPDAPTTFQGDLEQALLRNLRGGDYAAQLDWDVPNFAVLLPLTGPNGAAIFVERALTGWRHPDRWVAAHTIPVREAGDLDMLRSIAKRSCETPSAEGAEATPVDQGEPAACVDEALSRSLPEPVCAPVQLESHMITSQQ